MNIKKEWKPLLGAFLVAAAANLIGVPLFFNPIAEGDVGVQLVHPAVGFFTYVALCILLFHWAAVQLHSAYKAAFVVAGSQFLLIVDMTLAGKRGLATAAAGTVLLIVTWVCVSYLYSFLRRLGQESDEKNPA